MKAKFILFSIILILYSCKKENENVNKNTSKTQNETHSNITAEISTDIIKLQKIINLSEYKPEKVKFKYTFIDNSKGRLASPSDSFLEAVLYFDDKTVEKILEIDKNADFPTPNFEKQNFKFDWLDNEILSELENSDSQKSAHPDFIFGTENGECWYLKNKILLIQRIN